MNGATAFDRYADDYDLWFDENTHVYQAEVNALRRLIPQTGFGVEVGVGTGRFSTPFGIRIGVEPSGNMAQIAKSRNMAICLAVGEHLPFRDNQFDFALLVTVVCFVNDVVELLREVRRVIKVGGKVIVGFIDRDSALGRLYESRKDTKTFYKEARFYSPPEIAALVRQVGFGELQFCQTIVGPPNNNAAAYQVCDGWGEGAFVAVSGIKLNSEMEYENSVPSE
jgi:SAM-dependent methyltransferase